MDNKESKRKRMTKPTIDDIIIAEKNLQNKSGQVAGATGTEEWAFREFFCTSPLVATVLWNTMVARDITPAKGEINHLLWTLNFMKAYPKQGVACSMATLGHVLLQRHTWHNDCLHQVYKDCNS